MRFWRWGSGRTAAPPHPRRAAFWFVTVTGLIIVVSVAILALDSSAVRRDNPETSDAYVGGDTTPIAARVQGYITRLPIGDNQFVHAGDVLAEIESDDYRAREAAASAEVAAAEAKLQALDAQLREMTQQIGQTRSSQTAAEADLTRANPELVRQRALIKTELGVRRTLELAEDEQKHVNADIAAARAAVAVRERQADALAAERDQAAALLEARRADLQLARITLGWTRIVAPIDGTLGARLVREGDLLTVGGRIAVLTPLDRVWVDANFTERQITYIRLGQRARLVLDAFPDEILDGHVAGISPSTGGFLSAVPADNTTGNFTKVVQRVPVRIAIDWGDGHLRGLLRPGMSVKASVITGSTDAGAS